MKIDIPFRQFAKNFRIWHEDGQFLIVEFQRERALYTYFVLYEKRKFLFFFNYWGMQKTFNGYYSAEEEMNRLRNWEPFS